MSEEFIRLMFDDLRRDMKRLGILVPPGERLLNVSDVAARLRCSRSAVSKLRAEGKLPADFKPFDGAKGWRWKQSTIEEYLAIHATDPLGKKQQPDPPFISLHRSELRRKSA